MAVLETKNVPRRGGKAQNKAATGFDLSRPQERGSNPTLRFESEKEFIRHGELREGPQRDAFTHFLVSGSASTRPPHHPIQLPYPPTTLQPAPCTPHITSSLPPPLPYTSRQPQPYPHTPSPFTTRAASFPAIARMGRRSGVGSCLVPANIRSMDGATAETRPL